MRKAKKINAVCALIMGMIIITGSGCSGRSSETDAEESEQVNDVDITEGDTWEFIPEPDDTSELCPDGTLQDQCSAHKPLYCDSGTLTDRCSLCGCPSGQECEVDESCTIVDDWGFVPPGYEIIFADDVEATTWDGSTGDNPNLQPWTGFFNSVHDNADILHKQILNDSNGEWYGDGDDWYSTSIVKRGLRSFRVHRPGQYPNDGDRMQLMSRFHTEYVWFGTWIYFPEDFELDEGWFTFGGIIEQATVSGERHVLFRELTMRGVNMQVHVNYRKELNGEHTEPGGLWDTGIEMALYRGQWVHFGYIVRWHPTEGFMEFYLNGSYVTRFDSSADPEIADAVTRWDGTTWYFFTMKHYSHEVDYETVYWDDLVFAVPEGTEW